MRTALTKALLLVSSLAAAFCGAAPVSAATGDDASAPIGKPRPNTQEVLPIEGVPEDLTLAVDRLNDSDDAALINDFSWDDSKKMLHVHYFGALGRLPQVLESYLPAGAYDLVQDPLSHSVLVSQEAPLIAAAAKFGLKVGAVFPEADNSGLWVRIVDPNLPEGSTPSGSAVSSVQSMIPVPIRWETMTRAPASSSRLSDSAPFWGGAAMHHTFSGGTSAELCTAGFAVVNGSTTAMLTADHCGASGDTWVAGFVIGSGANMGTMSSGNSGGSDFKKISGKTYGGTVWLGEVTSSTTQAVKGKFSAIVGDSVCYDGAKSGQRCGNNVTNADGIIDNGGTFYNNEVDTVSGSHSGVAQGGDSGSPVLKGVTGGAAVGGVLSASNPNTKAPCVNGSAGPCYYEEWYAAVRAFLNNNAGWSVVTN